ncbi:galactose mutarotase-like domain-containing protein [Desarmillaria tabescens]|uniref:Galactose mutarotase-like domain-containing protein n=1 Tax=Armillaria tabescens TaxID=1929756 RepID=A0AA39NGK6_ARMTA|nr:galactose mutarotase-like domain-containing protein [Desarmillaria tabescens]KAK0465139.1 galactose mutarotase-like domain-containing protein [Desarmillaria tabescens]
MSGRSFGTFQKNAGYLTGANILDVARIGIDLGVRTANTTLISDAYARIHAELIVHYEVKSDGIREDGSFGQHGGLLYNGNYGKDYSNDVLQLEYAAAGTEFEANSDSKTAFEALIDGDKWMIYYNTLTASALGRFISFPVIDGQATSSILLNLTEVEVLGNLWSSNILTSFSQSLSTNVTHANAGNLSGNRMFYANDYMVHRGSNYMSTVKMVSTRTLTSECVNSQNPLGFHLSDGALYTYIQGDEYEDISVAWDWQLIPGITVNYNVTPLNCGNTGYTGVQSFVGGVSDGNIGIAAMRYTNPYDRSLSWQKAWFFLHDDVQHIMISNVSSNNNAPIYSVLDQKRHYGPIIVDTIQRSSQSTTLFVDIGEKTGNWSSIGTSTQPPATVDLFAAWLQHDSTVNTSFSYTAFPGISLESFLQKGQHFSLQSVQNDAHASALYDQAHQTIMAVFWDAAGGSVNLNVSGPLYNASRVLTISVTGNIALLYDERPGNISVSDPSQTLDTVDVAFTFSGQTVVEKKTTISFPTNHFSCSSASQQL